MFGIDDNETSPDNAGEIDAQVSGQQTGEGTDVQDDAQTSQQTGNGTASNGDSTSHVLGIGTPVLSVNGESVHVDTENTVRVAGIVVGEKDGKPVVGWFDRFSVEDTANLELVT
jgi:hypothetical protein